MVGRKLLISEQVFPRANESLAELQFREKNGTGNIREDY